MLQFESEIVLFELKSNLILSVFNRNTISLLNFESDLKGTTMTTIFDFSDQQQFDLWPLIT